MASELRDLEADRRTVRLFVPRSKDQNEVAKIAIAALDEIERLKGLLVRQCSDGWVPVLYGCITPVYATEADAWAAVRKAAMK